MDFLELVKTRRSVRVFLPTEVEEEKLQQILEAAKWAPSAGNLQARDFIIVRNPEKRRQLAEAAYGQDFIAEAPVVLVVCANRGKSAKRYGRRGESLYCIQDATASVENILLMAHAVGLASCWVGAFDEEEVKEKLNIPEDVMPVAILPLGYAAEKPIAPSRRIDVHKEVW